MDKKEGEGRQREKSQEHAKKGARATPREMRARLTNCLAEKKEKNFYSRRMSQFNIHKGCT